MNWLYNIYQEWIFLNQIIKNVIHITWAVFEPKNSFSSTQKGRHTMEIKTYILKEMAYVRQYVDAVLEDITDEQFNWQPSGTISPISTITLHLLAAEDYFIQNLIQGEPLNWVVQGWGQKIGVPAPPEQGRNWDEFKTVRILVAPVLAYQQALRITTDAYLDNLSEGELERRVVFAGNELSVAELLMRLIYHSACHAGEIAAIKGMQGIKGLPY